MQYEAFERGILVNGQTVNAILDGFAIFKKVPSDIMLRAGIGRPGSDGLVEVEPDEWYAYELWLEAFKQIGEAIGAGAIYGIGLKIPEGAIFPDWVVDIHSAIRSIDIAYHMNHKRDGQVMFDPATGRMTEGIGHYGYTPIAGEKRILSTCKNPYPCDLDRGIITAMARRFAPDAWIDHVEPDVCRKKGAEQCTYLVTWR